MVIVAEREVEGSEGPREITLENVRYWSKHTKELKGSQVKKALQFLQHDCLQYVGEDQEYDVKGAFICLPLNTQESYSEYGRTWQKKPFAIDYNFSAYKITKGDGKTFVCNCQGWQTKLKRNEVVAEGANCSHVLALYYAFKMKKFRHPSQQTLRVEWPDDEDDD